jgi:hypothetical protein
VLDGKWTALYDIDHECEGINYTLTGSGSAAVISELKIFL